MTACFNRTKVLAQLANVKRYSDPFWYDCQGLKRTNETTKIETVGCETVGQVIRLMRGENQFCLIIFNEQRIELGHELTRAYLIVVGDTDVEVTFHAHYTHARFERLNRFRLEIGANQFEFRRTRSRLLPHPYSTDCYD